MNQAVKFLTIARDRLTDSSNWVQGEYAKIRGNGAVDPLNEEADQWCALGALRWAAHAHSDDVVYDARTYLEKWLADSDYGTTEITHFNDYGSRQHEEVLEMFDGAIELAKKDTL